MALVSLIRIIKVGEVKDKEWEGRKYQTREAECLLMSDDGEIDCVGVLRLDEESRKTPPEPGIYQAKFALRASAKNRVIEAYLTGLTPVAPGSVTKQAPLTANAAPAAPKA